MPVGVWWLWVGGCMEDVWDVGAWLYLRVSKYILPRELTFRFGGVLRLRVYTVDRRAEEEEARVLGKRSNDLAGPEPHVRDGHEGLAAVAVAQRAGPVHEQEGDGLVLSDYVCARG